eukprot:m.31443 g.31443  ORF g.31443 m.31443 type:complete len:770 (-) comp4883_c0_seq2:146-2455(-)
MPAITIGVVVALLALAQGAAGAVADYDVSWNDLAKESATEYTNTMPIGNGYLAANVLGGDALSGTITLLISQSGAWSEAGELIKVGFVTLTFTPNPFSKGSFFQMSLNVSTATVQFLLGGSSAAQHELAVNTYVDANQDTIVVAAQSGSATPFTVSVQSTLVRTQPQTFMPQYDCWNYTVAPDQFGDVTASIPDSVVFYHRNVNTTFFKNTLTGENIPGAMSAIPDRLEGRTTGAVVFGQGLTRTSQSTLVSAAPATAVTVGIAVVTRVTPTLQPWLDAAVQLAQLGIPSRAEHESWWAALWNRSHIETSDFIVTRQYVLERYLQSIQARSPFPIKFNGLLFTANRAPKIDYRQGGGLNWWQNLRLPYYNMLGSGDFDQLATLFDSFLGNLPLAQARTSIYYNHTGAFWPEYTHPLMGTTHPESYGCDRAGKSDPPVGYSEDRYNHYNLQGGGLDLSLMILDHYTHTQDLNALKKYLPLVVNGVLFYTQRWSEVGPDGKLIFFPTQSLETWQCPGYPPNQTNCVTNDTPTIVGLQAVLARLLTLPAGLLDPATIQALTKFRAQVPPLPLGTSAGKPVILPCKICPANTSNVENAELYPVHPYRLYGVGKPNLDTALNTFAVKRFVSDIGWNQNAMDAALLGLATQAQAYVVARANTAPATGYRFPAFMPDFQDYAPSSDHLGVFSNALTYMLIQSLDDPAQTILLLPAWPCAWDVSFKVHGPLSTVIEGQLHDGKLTFAVTPASRLPAVMASACQDPDGGDGPTPVTPA